MFALHAQLFTFQNINHKNGLALSSVTALGQDNKQYIWVGTDGAGLQRYDGTNFVSIKVPNAQNEHHVTSVDPEGDAVYFSSRYFGFFCYRSKKYEKLLDRDLKFGEYLLIRKTKNCLYLVGSKKMLVIQDNRVVQSHFFKTQIKQIKQALETPQGLLLFGENFAYFMNESTIENLNEKNFNGRRYTFEAAQFVNQRIEIFDFSAQVKLSFSNTGITDQNLEKVTPFNQTVSLPIHKAYARSGKLFLIDSLNNLFHYTKGDFNYVPKNYKKNNTNYAEPFIDHNQDFWAGSGNDGLFKISLNPFTKIDLHEVYQNPIIAFIYRHTDNTIILSRFDGISLVGSFKTPNFKEIKLRIYAQCSFKGTTYFATSKGIYYLKGGNLLQFTKIPLQAKINFIYSDDENLYYSVEGKGLSRYHEGKVSQLIPSYIVTHFYTAQTNFEKGKIYFGTNDGIFEYLIASKQFNHLKKKFHYGEYAGVSTKDSYGNCWFSYGKMIVGITAQEEYLTITDKKWFNSTLFYSLMADNFGNILIGTNVGITKVKLNAQGEVLGSFHFHHRNGFDGYETHMRSQFNYGKYHFIGTIEGLFSIDTELLEHLPKPARPLIQQSTNSSQSKSILDDPVIHINYSIINPKLEGVYYSYRLKGKSDRWSELTTKTDVYFPNLTEEDYIFEVKSTYDKEHFSSIASLKINKQLPFWKSKWFLLFIILAIALANIIVLDRSKTFELSQIIENQDIEMTSRVQSVILGFGFLSNTGAHYLAQQVDSTIPSLFELNIFTALLLFILFILSLFRNHRFNQWNKYLLHAALIVILFQCYVGSYASKINPLYIIIISLCASLTPFVLKRMSEVLIFSAIQIVTAIVIVFLVENAIFNEILFMIAVIVAVTLSLFTQYLRSDSLQKLAFISGIVNKGKLIAIAYNNKNEISYMSENVYAMLAIKPEDYLGKPLSELNAYVHWGFTKNEIDLTQAFHDEELKVIPMRKSDGSEIWMEWSSAALSKSNRIVFGQDITERVNIENNYESLVEYTDDLIFRIDVEGRFVFVNSQFEEKLGYTPDELLHRNSSFLASESYTGLVNDFYRKQFKERIRHSYFEFPISKKDGTQIWIGQKTSLLYASGSNKIISGFLALARDITEKKEQRELIEEQHANIKHSITYAKNIQNNLLPKTVDLAAHFTEFALFSSPKEIVTGDFYWFKKNKEKSIFILADCSGHGIPGSFMTLLAINLLNQVVRPKNMDNPGEILQELDEKFLDIFNGGEGLDLPYQMCVSVLLIDKTKQQVKYACAGAKFITTQADGPVVHRGETKSIGEPAETHFIRYHTYELPFSEYVQIYLFTDGLIKQLNTQNKKPFSLKRLLEVLSQAQSNSVQEHLNMVQEKFEAWRDEGEQNDDITLIGIKP